MQWLFPLYVESQFNPNAPLLTDEVRAAFTDPENPGQALLQQIFGSAIYRMLVFYVYSFSPGSNIHDLVEYLNSKLAETPVGGKHLRKGTKLCSSFEEWRYQ